MPNPTLITIMPTLIVTHDEDGTGGTLTEGWDVTPVEVDIEGGDTTYDFLSSVAGSPFDVIRLDDGVDMWIDDEGLLKGLHLNPIASVLAAPHRIVGPVVLARCNNEGETIGFTDEQLRRVLNRITVINAALTVPIP